MAITDVVVLYEDAVEEAKAEKGAVRRSATRVLLAKTDARNPFFAEIAEDESDWPGLGNTPIPKMNDEVYFGEYQMFVASRKFSWFKGTERGVQIDVRYESRNVDYDDDSNSDNPTSDGSTWRRITVSSSQITVPASESQDIDGETAKPITNMAGDPVDGLEEETAVATMTYTNNYAENPNLSGFYEWMNKINQVQFLGAPIRTLRFTGFNAEFDDLSQLWRVSVELTFNPKEWKIGYYNAGYNELVSGQRRAILDARGNPVSSPVPLDDIGAAKTVGEDPDILYAYPYEQKDFSTMLADLRI